MSEETIILFGPKNSKALNRIYPELVNEPVFKELPADEMLFVWYYGNLSSPIDPEQDDKLRATAAAAIAFKKSPDKMKKFSSMIFPESIKLAVKKMGTYSPEARAAGKRIAQNNLNNLMKMSNVKLSDFDIEKRDAQGNISVETDWSGRNQYISGIAKTTETIKELIKQVEEGFGVEVSDGTPFNGKKGIDVFHSIKE